MTGHVVLHDDILVVPDASSDLRFFDHPLVRQHPGVRFYAGAPIRATNDATLGALSIMAFEPRSLESDEHELLRELAASVEHEIGTSSLGLVDPLTGFFNQKGLRLVADHVLRRSNRYGEAVSMLIINLEDLDAINLEAGRGAGDAALVQIAEILRDTVRSADVPARMRADDFAVILPDTDEEGAALLAARIRRGLLGRQRRISSDFPSAVQIARGTVYPTEDDFTLKDLINLTDIAG
jgi:diguanylate cyclase (GGDEF)-like protein